MSAQNITVTFDLAKDVYERVSETASHEHRPLEEMLSKLVGEGLHVHATMRELFEAVSSQYRGRLSHEGKLNEPPEAVIADLRELREQIADELYPE